MMIAWAWLVTVVVFTVHGIITNKKATVSDAADDSAIITAQISHENFLMGL